MLKHWALRIPIKNEKKYNSCVESISENKTDVTKSKGPLSTAIKMRLWVNSIDFGASID
jgi:hypothetical protein